MAQPPPFFFSYAHNDVAFDDRAYLFYKNVNQRLRLMAGLKDDGFFDQSRLKAGDDWSSDLVDALSKAPVMVCVYSPSYFNSVVCGQELQVFLERRLAYLATNVGRPPSSIIPVRWVSPDVPLALPDFQFEKPRSREFADLGLWDLGDPALEKKLAAIASRDFEAAARSVATRVKEALATPLPPLAYKPRLGGVASAFEPRSLPPAEFGAVGGSAGPQTATFVYTNGSTWREFPFAPPERKSWLYIAASVAQGRDLQPQALTFDPAAADLLGRIQQARAQNNLLVMLVDGRSLNDANVIARLQEVDEKRYETCSALVVWPTGKAVPALAPRAFPKLSERREPFFHASIDQPQDFAKAVGSSLDALQNSILKNAINVTAVPGSSTYSSPPAVSAAPHPADPR